MVRESQRTGKVLGAINSTFLFLIPKSQDGITFEDFRPISCRNVYFNIISKFIARHLKPMLSEIISEEQFGFLWNRQIHDAMAISQEVLHLVKSKKQKETILKLNLSKVYDRVNQTFLHLVLLQMGMNLQMINWIMGCIQSDTFAVLINGSPSRFFKASRGLR